MEWVATLRGGVFGVMGDVLKELTFMNFLQNPMNFEQMNSHPSTTQ